MKNLIKTLTMTLILLGTLTVQANIGKPRDPTQRRGQPGKIGIGKMEQNNSIARKLMEHLGWEDSLEYEETGLKMKNLIVKLISTNAEAKAWILNVNKYFESGEFTLQRKADKAKDIYEAKMYLKMAIHQEGLLEPRRYSKACFRMY